MSMTISHKETEFMGQSSLFKILTIFQEDCLVLTQIKKPQLLNVKKSTYKNNPWDRIYEEMLTQIHG